MLKNTKKDSNKRDGFFELYGISEEEEEFFKVLYKRRQIYRRIIYVLSLAIAILIVLLSMQ